jgi:hypothetical protein
MFHSSRAAWAPTRRLLAVLAAASVAAACGGGGDSGDSGSESAASSAEGFYLGTMAGGTPNYFEKLVLENNEVWLVYGTRASPGAAISILGPMNGTGTFSGGTLTATAIKDFGVAPAATGTFTTSYKINSKSRVTSVSGVASVGGKSLTLTGDSNVSNYRYSDAASLAALSGNWTLPVASGAPGTVSINSSGGFSFNLSGCAASGTMVTRASGKNVFNATMTFGAAPCAFPGVTFSGVAFVAPNTFLGTAGDLRILVRNSAQTAGLVLAGTR